jgi:hypothetical protein
MIKEILLIFLIIIWLNDKINVDASALETERNNSDVVSLLHSSFLSKEAAPATTR